MTLTGGTKPELGPDARYGLSGRALDIIEPHTEADPVALLGQLLVAFGNVIGREPHFVVESDCHSLNLFLGLVGASSKGRKGTSWGHVRKIFERVDAGWALDRVKSNLSSGEGLIWAVRDPIKKHVPVKKGGRVVDYQDIVDDPGVSDKRLLPFETEFASALRSLGREGNTLSAVIRQAWDTGDLRILTKNSPAVATKAHISLIGHITKDELLRYMDRTEIGNGFANRFLWLVVRRARCLPEGGKVPEDAFASLQRDVSEAVHFARSVGRIDRSADAREYWAVIYPMLSEGHFGMLGAVTSRAEAQVARLSCLYALLDLSPLVQRQHLEAALALWQYAEESAAFIFGRSTGDSTADRIRAELEHRPKGLSRTEIRDLFQKNRGAEDIDRAPSVDR